MPAILALKLFLVPSLIAAVTLSGRKWGAMVAGWLSAFPIVSGPILFFLGWEHGTAFARQATEGTASAILAILSFGISYAWGATRFGWIASTVCGFAGYALAVLVITSLTPPLWLTAAVILPVLYFSPAWFPRLPPSSAGGAAGNRSLVLRMISGAILVLSVTYFSSSLGPRLSGLFAMFPVMSTVLVVFSHRESGAGFAVQLLRGMVYGWYSFLTFCLALNLALATLGLGTAFAIALTAAVAVQLGSRRLLRQA
jgi:hypothetical protein